MTPRIPDRARPRERLGVHACAGDDDRTGRADVHVLRAQLAVGARRDLEATPRRSGEGDAAEDGAGAERDRDAGPGSDVMDHAR